MPVFKVREADASAAGRQWAWLTALNLHWAGVGLLALVNLFILAQMGLLWHSASQRSPEAMTAQRIQLKAAEIAAIPLRGLDAKLAAATTESDRFYRDRLPASYSEVVDQLGVLPKRARVRQTRVSYVQAQVLPGTVGELSEVRMDATLSGDYRPLVQLINSLERDRIFFVINAMALTGQQSGNVSLRLKLTTYLQPNGTAGSAGALAPVVVNGGPAR